MESIRREKNRKEVGYEAFPEDIEQWS